MKTAIPAEDFDHGDPRRYRRGCRCQQCKTGQSLRNRQLRFLRQTGRSTRRTPDKAAQHLLQLRSRGLSDKKIQQLTKSCPDVMYRILRREGSITYTVERRILSVPIPEPTSQLSESRVYIPGLGTRRRLQALVAAGWPPAELARRLGKERENLGQIIKQKDCAQVAMYIADQVDRLYAELHNRNPEAHGVTPFYARRARQMAADRGWYAPGWWDGDEFENPDYQPVVTKTPRYIALAEDCLELERQGYTREQIAERLGVTRDGLQRALSLYRQKTADDMRKAA